MYGWEYHFSIDWAAAEQGPNTRKVSGYVYNQHGEFATHLRVLAQAIDSGGAVVGQRIAYVPGGVGGFGRAYFEVPNLPATDAYPGQCLGLHLVPGPWRSPAVITGTCTAL